MLDVNQDFWSVIMMGRGFWVFLGMLFLLLWFDNYVFDSIVNFCRWCWFLDIFGGLGFFGFVTTFFLFFSLSQRACSCWPYFRSEEVSLVYQLHFNSIPTSVAIISNRVLKHHATNLSCLVDYVVFINRYLIRSVVLGW